MYPDTTPAGASSPATNGRFESLSFYALILTVILAPLAFWPSPYVALDLVKSVVIAVGTLLSASFFGIVAIKERKLALPPRSLFWTGLLIAVSMMVSAATSIQFMKSFMGQGFEIGTASFLLIAMLSGVVAFALVSRKSERAVVIYTAIASAYIILFIFQVLRFFLGNGFASLSILNTVTSSIVGTWSSFGFYSGLMIIISASALMLLPLSRKMKAVYAVLGILAAFAVFIVDNPGIWFLLALVFLAFTIFASIAKPKTASGISGFFRRIAWMPLILFVVFGVLYYAENSLSKPVLDPRNAQNTEVNLPWQMTLDVASGAIKNYPIFGVGPNHFAQAYLVYKPLGANQGNGWSVEFGTGFGLLPTFVVAQGIVGTILWVLFLVLLGVFGWKTLRSLSSDPTERFIVVSSYTGAVFLWLCAALFVPAHAMFMLTLVMTGVATGSAVAFGRARALVLAPQAGRMHKLMPSFMLVLVLVAVVWGLVYVKKTVALSYFSAGVKQLTTAGNPTLADSYFKQALSIDLSDVYWQARAEAALGEANQLSSTVNAQTAASTSQAVLTQVVGLINNALQYSRNAIAYDPTNYYNYVSEARVSQTGVTLQLQNAYDNAVAAYGKAIALNPYNPSLYLALARLQASQSKYDDALRSVGTALQAKNDYLDAVFLMSQIDAAKGDLPQAITAAQFAIQLNPNNPFLYFQLGLLEYNSKDYSSASKALAQAVSLQPDYANAQYFLGLSDARLGNVTDAVAQFSTLAKANPDNQEVQLILSNLQAGKPIFTDAVPPVTPNPEKRSELPIKQK